MATKFDHTKCHDTKTYATEANADKAMSKFGDEVRYIVVKREDNRFQPIVIDSARNAAWFAHNGFVVVG